MRVTCRRCMDTGVIPYWMADGQHLHICRCCVSLRLSNNTRPKPDQGGETR